MKFNKFEMTILFFCLVGLVVASISLYYHFADASESFCTINDRFNCQTVYQSEHSYVFGIPVPLLGIFAYLALPILILAQRSIREFLAFSHKEYWQYMGVITTIMLAFQGFLTYLSAFVIGAFCLLCVISQVSILAIAILAWMNFRQ